MRLNNKGFSMIELFAVIFISTAIIFPMMTTLVNNFEINDRMHNRRSATSIAQGTMEGINRFDFVDIESKVTSANSGGTYYIELSADNCNTLSDTADQAICSQLFGSIWNNLTLTSSEFKVFMYNYNMTAAMQTSLTNNSNLPPKVREQIALITPTTTANPELYRITIWIEYDIDTGQSLVLDGLISND